MQFSNKYVFSKRKKKELEDAIIAQISFNELEEKVSELSGKPVVCNACGAAVLKAETIKDEKPLGLHFVCSFCDTLNKIDEREFNLLKDMRKKVVEYLEELIGRKFDERIVACIDISGSMKGKPLQGVKQSIVETLRDLATNSPETGFALITFTDTVTLYNSKEEAIINLVEKELYQENLIRTTFDGSGFVFEKIGDSHEKWIKIISSIQGISQTALGPAVLGAFSLLKENGRIILLTDGLANYGVGSLQSYGTGRKGEFYTELGKECRDAGVIVEIVGVVTSPSSSMDLETIGEMARLTGGDVYLVDLSEIKDTFRSLSRSDTLGRNVKVKMFLPKSVKLKDVAGDIMFRREQKFFEAKMGSVNPDRKISLSLEPSENLTPEEKIPVQVQIDYTGPDGIKRKRVYQEEISVTDNEKDIIENFKSEVSDIFYKQKSAELGRRGDEEGGIRTLRKYTEDLLHYKTKAQGKKKEGFATSELRVTRDLEDMENLKKTASNDLKYSEYQARVAYGKTAALRAQDRRTRIDTTPDMRKGNI